MKAFRFELTRVQVPAIRERVVAQLVNVARELAQGVADGLGMPLPKPLPVARPKVERPEVAESGALSLFARPGATGARGRRVAILAADGVDGAALLALHAALTAEGAVPRLLGVRLGAVESTSGPSLPIESTLEAMPCVLFDALVVPGGESAIAQLAADAHAVDFVKDTYRHCKPLLVIGAGAQLLELARVPAALPDGAEDPGLLIAGDGEEGDVTPRFVEAIARHRHFEREMDPPPV